MRRRGAAQGGRVGGIFGDFFDGYWDLRIRKRREDATNRSQMVTGGEGDVYAALADESALPGPPKQESGRRIPYCALAGR